MFQWDKAPSSGLFRIKCMIKIMQLHYHSTIKGKVKGSIENC